MWMNISRHVCVQQLHMWIGWEMGTWAAAWMYETQVWAACTIYIYIYPFGAAWKRWGERKSLRRVCVLVLCGSVRESCMNKHARPKWENEFEIERSYNYLDQRVGCFVRDKERQAKLFACDVGYPVGKKTSSSSFGKGDLHICVLLVYGSATSLLVKINLFCLCIVSYFWCAISLVSPSSWWARIYLVMFVYILGSIWLVCIFGIWVSV
jgi:hypothetical protein